MQSTDEKDICDPVYFNHPQCDLSWRASSVMAVWRPSGLCTVNSPNREHRCCLILISLFPLTNVFDVRCYQLIIVTFAQGRAHQRPVPANHKASNSPPRIHGIWAANASRGMKCQMAGLSLWTLHSSWLLWGWLCLWDRLAGWLVNKWTQSISNLTHQNGVAYLWKYISEKPFYT